MTLTLTVMAIKQKQSCELKITQRHSVIKTMKGNETVYTTVTCMFFWTATYP